MDDLLDNSSQNESNFYEDYDVKSTLYRKIMGTVIFTMVWPFIVLDIKRFPLGRPAAALVGATLMIIFVVTPQDQVYMILGEKGNLQTLFLLVGMMLLSYFYDREGILQHVTLWIFGKSKQFKHILWKVCMLSAVLSAMITNDAASLVLTPLLLIEHKRQKRSAAEYPPLLLGIATSANIGSASTFFGNPQNAFIAANSKGEVSLLVFFITTLPAAIIGLVINVPLLYLFYFRTIWPKKLSPATSTKTDDGIGLHPSDTEQPKVTGAVYSSGKLLTESREELALSYDQSTNPYHTSQISQEHRGFCTSTDTGTSLLSNKVKSGFITRNNPEAMSMTETTNDDNSVSQDYGTIGNNTCDHVLSGRISRLYFTRFSSSTQLSDIDHLQDGAIETPPITMGDQSQATWRQRVFISWLVLVTCILVLLLAMPPLIPAEFNLGIVPVGVGVMTMLVDTVVNRKYAYDAMMKVDWTMILMFMGLFIWLGGFENTLIPTNAFQFLRKYMDLYTFQGVIIFTLFVVIGSNILSNVPLVILIMDQLFNFECGSGNFCTGQLAGVILAWTSTVAGNFTLIGSVANLIVAEKARNITNYRLGFWEYLKFGFSSTTLVLIFGVPIVFFAGDNLKIT